MSKEISNEQGNEQKKAYNCPVCGAGVKFTTDPTTKKLKAIKCATNIYDQQQKKNVGCDFIVYSNQKLLEPKLLLKDELKALVGEDTLRINNLTVFIDAKNPTIGKNKKKEEVRYYLKIERDEDIEEEVV
ncbi:hypothetical protein [Sulfurimonas sp.]|uniref:hypothetical protein n=1 Tax=Sulfurimonas sp. TaxID=2022749 RepID=UPI002B482312|nr:hypothetical protein [Sulfurimonas sp.]